MASYELVMLAVELSKFKNSVLIFFAPQLPEWINNTAMKNIAIDLLINYFWLFI
jgi:hypothetical protein